MDAQDQLDMFEALPVVGALHLETHHVGGQEVTVMVLELGTESLGGLAVTARVEDETLEDLEARAHKILAVGR